MAWTGWYHVNGNTYGTWLRGDHRGWRTRHHREHVEGDYKHPPAPGTFEQLEQHSKELMQRPAIRLDYDQCRLAGQAMIDKLMEYGVQVIAVSVDAVHYHVLAKFQDTDVRTRIGLAKKNAAFALRGAGIIGGAWAKRCRALPIETRSHQHNVFYYILRHRDKGAWTWHFEQGVYWQRVS